MRTQSSYLSEQYQNKMDCTKVATDAEATEREIRPLPLIFTRRKVLLSVLVTFKVVHQNVFSNDHQVCIALPSNTLKVLGQRTNVENVGARRNSDFRPSSLVRVLFVDGLLEPRKRNVPTCLLQRVIPVATTKIY